MKTQFAKYSIGFPHYVHLQLVPEKKGVLNSKVSSHVRLAEIKKS